MGPFRFNVGHYFGGSMGGTTTARTTAQVGDAIWQKNHTLGSPSTEEKTDKMLNEFFDVQSVQPSYEQQEEYIEEQHPLSEKLVYSIMFFSVIVAFGQMFLFPLWSQLIPIYSQLVLYMTALIQNRHFEVFGTSQQILAFVWFVVMQLQIHFIVLLV